MKPLENEQDLTEMLSEENAALFLFVDWSDYARRGREVFTAAAAKFGERSCDRSVSWWIFDLSSISSPVSEVLHRWLTLQKQRAEVRMFPNIATGNGSVVWIKSGQIVGFEANAQLSGHDALAHRTEKVFS
jgi:hypothetical protein